ncbi:hypothetical protein O6H91_08G076900 [Diphasiastrum complanatum]|uniref:Uncharacterized protein n=3 Tax=Diphasiastrum complanatum TaxID=34168 RepID=A0ACC2CZ25_DIPCM|nr:hypothetical protein O6H91_08G076500 [Diphasiastrum complanatum]KAJ7547246.1 hypothetical protein O6H91_08G076900 [Diphasiastrum complanatum]KAJ7547247.1 hypothetical protein O6H91_08G076900 [Diphasiastrum complanatum]
MMATDVVNVKEFQVLAKQKLPKMVYGFYASGAEDEWTLEENERAYQTIRIWPRILLDVSNVDLSTRVLGFDITMPVMIAPTSMHKMAHPDGELATAQAAAAAGTVMVLSTGATSSIEEVAQLNSGIRFFQLYIFNKTNAIQLVQRAEKSGYKAIVLTVDTPRLGHREADKKNRFALPPHLSLKNLIDVVPSQEQQEQIKGSKFETLIACMDQELSWKDVKWLQTVTKLPVLIKGVLTVEATEQALQASVAGIIVSNHGGRQLDHVPATISVLEEIVVAARGRIPVFLDGGIRRGTDIFKALALGASGVFVGRPILFALAIDGETGVKKALQILHDELELTMALAGCCKISDIKRSHVRTLRDRNRPSSRL